MMPEIDGRDVPADHQVIEYTFVGDEPEDHSSFQH